MQTDALFYVTTAAVLLVLGILITGIIVFIRGGEANKKYGNLLMRLRVIAQAVALGLILLFILLSGGKD